MVMSKFELTKIIEARLCEILIWLPMSLKNGKANLLPAGVAWRRRKVGRGCGLAKRLKPVKSACAK